MRIAVTGATGFVGSSAVRHLAAIGHEIVAFGRRPANDPAALALVSRRDGPAPRDDAAAASDRATPTDAVTYRRWDITRPLLDAPRVDAVVHCAAEVAGGGPCGGPRPPTSGAPGTSSPPSPTPPASSTSVPPASTGPP